MPFPNDDTKFKKGKSGNPNGRPPKLPELDALLANVLGEEKDGKTAAEAILMKLRQLAAAGNIRAAEVLLNRGYGLPPQKIEQSGTLNFVWNELRQYDSEQKTDEGT